MYVTRSLGKPDANSNQIHFKSHLWVNLPISDIKIQISQNHFSVFSGRINGGNLNRTGVAYSQSLHSSIGRRNSSIRTSSLPRKEGKISIQTNGSIDRIGTSRLCSESLRDWQLRRMYDVTSS